MRLILFSNAFWEEISLKNVMQSEILLDFIIHNLNILLSLLLLDCSVLFFSGVFFFFCIILKVLYQILQGDS